MFYMPKQHFAGVLSAWNAIKIIVIASLCLLVQAACTPTFNWREVSLEQAGATALLPCKPDRAERAVQLAGQTLQMRMAGCEAGGAMFTLAWVHMMPTSQEPLAVQMNAVAAEWKAANKATHSRQLTRGAFIMQASIYGHPNEGRDGPGALSAQAVETFLSSLNLLSGVGAQ